ncbi:hypothetical protein BC332_00078 [Capsicum chinense]|nr:hypothetical protein BC332_00078 [Capsicum chinense]
MNRVPLVLKIFKLNGLTWSNICIFLLFIQQHPFASQPLQHALGRPWTLRSEVSTKAPAVPPPPVPVRVSMSKNAPKLVPPSPVPPLGSTSDRMWLIPVPTKAPALPPPPVRLRVKMSKNDPMLVSPHPVPAPASMSKNAPNLVPPPPVPAQVSMSKNAPKLVPPPGFSPPPVPVRVSMSKSAPKLVPPPGFPPPPVSVRVSMSKNVPKLVPPPPVPPLGLISARPWLIPGYKEDEQRETKLKLTPLSRLIAEKKTHTCTSGSSSQMDEKSKKEVTDGVKSNAFTMLNLFGADYGSFYNDVKDLIKHKYDLLTADRKLDMLSVSELEEKYLDAVTKEEQCVNGDEQKRAARRIAQAEVEKLGTQMKIARVAQGEIERCKNKALQGIESTTQRLLSYK